MSVLVKENPPPFSEADDTKASAASTPNLKAIATCDEAAKTAQRDSDRLCEELEALPVYRTPASILDSSMAANAPPYPSLDSMPLSDPSAGQQFSPDALKEENARLKQMLQELIREREALLQQRQYGGNQRGHSDATGDAMMLAPATTGQPATLRLRDGTLAKSLGDGSTVLYHPSTLTEKTSSQTSTHLPTRLTNASPSIVSSALQRLESPYDDEDEMKAAHSPVVEALRRDVIQAYTPAAAAFHLSAQDPSAIQWVTGNSHVGVMEVIDFEEHQLAEMLAQQGKTPNEIRAALRSRRRVYAELERRERNPRIAEQADQLEATWAESLAETGSSVASASAYAVSVTARAAVAGARLGVTALGYASYLALRFPQFIPESHLAIARACCNALIAAGVASTSPLLAYFVTNSPAGRYAIQQLGFLVAAISEGMPSASDVTAIAGEATHLAAAIHFASSSEDEATQAKQRAAEEQARVVESRLRLAQRIERSLPLRPNERVVEVRDAVLVPTTVSSNSEVSSDERSLVASLPPVERADVEELAAFVGVADDDWWVLVSASRHAQLRAEEIARRNAALRMREERLRIKHHQDQMPHGLDHDQVEEEFEEVDELEALELKYGRLDPNGFIMDPQENRVVQNPPQTVFDKLRRLLMPPIQKWLGRSETTAASKVSIVPMPFADPAAGKAKLSSSTSLFLSSSGAKLKHKTSPSDSEPIELQPPRDRRLQPPPPSYEESLGSHSAEAVRPDAGRAYWSRIQSVQEREAQKRVVKLMQGGPSAAQAQAEIDLELDDEPTNGYELTDGYVTIGDEHLQGYASPRSLGYASTYTAQTAVEEDRAQRAERILAQEAEVNGNSSADAEARSRAELEAANALADASLLKQRQNMGRADVGAEVPDANCSSDASAFDEGLEDESEFVVLDDNEIQASIQALLEQSVRATRDTVLSPTPTPMVMGSAEESEPIGESKGDAMPSADKQDQDAAQIAKGNSTVQEAIQSFRTAKNVLMKHIQVGRWICTVYYVGKVALKVFRQSTPSTAATMARSAGASTVRMILSCGLEVSYLLFRRARGVLRR